MKNRKYSESLLFRLVNETKNIEDHIQLIQLYKDLDYQGDIQFSDNLRSHFKNPTHYFRFLHKISSIKQLCQFCLHLLELQEKQLAIVTCYLQRRIEHQREFILLNKRK